MTFTLTFAWGGTSTPTPTITPTFFSARDTDLFPTFAQLLRSTYECHLPCLLGLRPGGTTKAEVLAFLTDTGFDRSWELSNLPFTLEEYMDYGEPFILSFLENPYSYTNAQLGFRFDESSEILTSFGVTFARADEWFTPEMYFVALPQLFQQFDMLPEIYVDPIQPAIGDLSIIYRDLGIRGRYYFTFTSVPDEPHTFEMCLNLSHGRGMSLSVHAENVMPERNLNTSGGLPIEEAFDVTLEEFVNFYRENPDGCLTLSLRLD